VRIYHFEDTANSTGLWSECLQKNSWIPAGNHICCLDTLSVFNQSLKKKQI